MAVLVDTSVWIKFLAGREEYVVAMKALAAGEGVLAHDFVAGELLMGDIGGRRKALAEYEWLPKVPAIPHDEVMQFVRLRRLHGRGIGWIDAHLLASAIAERVQFWTADSDLHQVALELGVAYRTYST